MAGIAKPSVEGLGSEVTYTINGFSLNGLTLAQGLFDGICANEWNTERVAYWGDPPHYIDITINQSCNMWRSGSSSWSGSNKPLVIKRYENGAFIDVTSQYPQTLTPITERQWEKFISDIPKGRYRFEYGGARMDSEWYLESTNSSLVLIKLNNKYYTLQNGEFIEVELTLDNFEEYGLTDLSQLTASTNKVLLTMGNGEIVGVGKAYSKKVNPMDWEMLIGGMNVK